MNNITLKQIRAFVAVATEKNFTKAANSLYVTQSTLTLSIKALEKEIGLKVFDRSTRSVTLTKQGEIFLPIAKRILQDLEFIFEDLQKVAARERGTVSVCAASSFITYVLTPALINLTRQYPGISTRFTEGTTVSVVKQVLSGEADFGITTLFEPITGLDFALLLTDSYGAVYNKKSNLDIALPPLTWSKLSQYNIIQLSKVNGIRALLDREPRISGLFYKKNYEVSSVAALQMLLIKDFGVAALPALAAKSLVGENLDFRLLSQPVIHRKLYVVKKKGRSLSPAAVSFFKIMIDSLESMIQDNSINIIFKQSEVVDFCL